MAPFTSDLSTRISGAVSSIAPTLHMELSNERLERIRETFGSSVDYYLAQAPWSLAREHAARLVGKTRVRLLAGSETPTAKANMELICQILAERGITNEIRQVPDAPHERLGRGVGILA
ncbi:uncharacterized protein N7483_002690 [Penicillium malachiteum]|uniref:uncharacterized protein n=1 Tax=Penicillium malachiteum TaxID=1324776 RepID=UPI002548CCA2|nr:uncharacterized protein N7483_002690 [Penicillium malachiteum]KAJ5737565.1 hypothetical protein N7483_002690 [Penicillium malachiteum]